MHLTCHAGIPEIGGALVQGPRCKTILMSLLFQGKPSLLRAVYQAPLSADTPKVVANQSDSSDSAVGPVGFIRLAGLVRVYS